MANSGSAVELPEMCQLRFSLWDCCNPNEAAKLLKCMSKPICVPCSADVTIYWPGSTWTLPKKGADIV